MLFQFPIGNFIRSVIFLIELNDTSTTNHCKSNSNEIFMNMFFGMIAFYHIIDPELLLPSWKIVHNISLFYQHLSYYKHLLYMRLNFYDRLNS